MLTDSHSQRYLRDLEARVEHVHVSRLGCFGDFELYQAFQAGLLPRLTRQILREELFQTSPDLEGELRV